MSKRSLAILFGALSLLIAVPVAAQDGCFVQDGIRACPVGPDPWSKDQSPGYGGREDPADTAAQEQAAIATQYNQAGIDAWNRGDWGVAGEQFQIAYRHNPNSDVIRRNLANARAKIGSVAWQEGDWERAANSFSSALLHDPGNAEYRQWMEAAQQKQAEARSNYDAEREDQRLFDQSYALNDQGRLAAEAGDWETALSYFQQAAARYPSEPAYATNIELANRRIREENERKAYIAQQEEELRQAQARAAEEKAQEEARARKAAEVSPVGPTTKGAFGTNQSAPVLEAAAPDDGLPKVGNRAIDQLISAAKHSLRAAASGDAVEAGKGFDVVGTYAGTLATPDSSGQVPDVTTRIPSAALNDYEVQQSTAYFQHLEMLRSDNAAHIAEVMEEEKAAPSPPAEYQARLQTLLYQEAELSAQMQLAETSIRKRVKDLGIEWAEEAPSGQKAEAKTQ